MKKITNSTRSSMAGNLYTCLTAFRSWQAQHGRTSLTTVGLLLSAGAIVAIITWFVMRSSSPEPALSAFIASAATSTSVNSKTTRILAAGDSLTAGYGLPLAESYPAQLQQALNDAGFDVEVINAGISGETTAGMLERIDFLLTQEPDIILLGIGGNDALRFFPPSQVRSNLEQITNTILRHEKKPALALLRIQAPVNAGKAYKQEFDSIYQGDTAIQGAPILDFVATEVMKNPQMVQEDGIHPNAEGYAYIVKQFLFPVLRDWFAQRNGS